MSGDIYPFSRQLDRGGERFCNEIGTSYQIEDNSHTWNRELFGEAPLIRTHPLLSVPSALTLEGRGPLPSPPRGVYRLPTNFKPSAPTTTVPDPRSSPCFSNLRLRRHLRRLASSPHAQLINPPRESRQAQQARGEEDSSEPSPQAAPVASARLTPPELAEVTPRPGSSRTQDSCLTAA